VLPPALILTYLSAVQASTPWAVPLLLVFAVYVAVQAIESFILSPVIESRSNGLHPVTVVVALLIGSQIAGLLGMLLAIPVASTLKSLGAIYVLPEIRRLAGLNDPRQPDAERPYQLEPVAEVAHVTGSASNPPSSSPGTPAPGASGAAATTPRKGA
jgi:hypothetical protein